MQQLYMLYQYSPSSESDIFLNFIVRDGFIKRHTPQELKQYAKIPFPEKILPSGKYFENKVTGRCSGPFASVSPFVNGVAFVQPVGYPSLIAIDLDGDIVINPTLIQTKNGLANCIEYAPISTKKYVPYKSLPAAVTKEVSKELFELKLQQALKTIADAERE